jgi:hypothetical protein
MKVSMLVDTESKQLKNRRSFLFESKDGKPLLLVQTNEKTDWLKVTDFREWRKGLESARLDIPDRRDMSSSG